MKTLEHEARGRYTVNQKEQGASTLKETQPLQRKAILATWFRARDGS